MIKQVIRFGMSFTYPCPRKLRQIMKMSLIEKQPVHSIENIWKEYHEPRVANISDVLTKQKYNHLTNKYPILKPRTNRSPLYLIPIHRRNGHFKLLTQWQQNCFLGTYLQDYKLKGHNAQPYIVFTIFTELLFTKGIVLVRGDVINNSLSKGEALKVWELLQQSYFEQERYELVDRFNNVPHQFSMDKYNELYKIHG